MDAAPWPEGVSDAVLVTRPLPAAEDTARRLAGMGYNPVIAPCLEIRSLPGALPRTVQATLATSANALPALARTHRTVRLLAVGDATAAHARGAGFSDVQSADGDAQALADLAVRKCDPNAGSLLLACGARQGADLARRLRSDGFRVIRRVVYRAERLRLRPNATTALASGSVCAVLFFSAETAHAFRHALPRHLLPALRSIEALTIGKAAADALGALPWRRVRVALRPTQDHLLALLHDRHTDSG